MFFKFYQFYQRAKDRAWATWTMGAGRVVSVSRPVELVKLLETARAQAKASPH